jgi:hypothetical protein
MGFSPKNIWAKARFLFIILPALKDGAIQNINLIIVDIDTKASGLGER